ncbi:alkene reductase [Nguyenibacter vanlangensis]|uniref:Alkene reductase n=1 Tax=Nguyenibacter vanlangensis TaxID=1216886 RepID=A0A7Y7ITP4_9PROT|nr:alkene reductase [Nguyenibacter vanlangensis]NVN09630.1 alkene reductase [Nguyenibacter vanlangensis]
MLKLYSPIALGAIHLSHRVVQAPLTRLRSEQPGDIPGDLMATHYGQRASEGGLQIAEATTVSIVGRGYLGAPGIYSDAQVVGWRKVTDAVHAKGGRIFLQLWHVGRQSHIDMTGGAAPVAPSAVPFEQVVFTANGWVPVSPARALETDEIPGIVEEFRQGAVRAKAAGFDGVEIHGANGYLIDQFIQDGTNKRTDQYGGPIENRARLLMEVVEAVSSVWGADRVGVRLGPSGSWASMHDSDPAATFGYIANALNRYGLAYLHIIEPRVVGGEVPDESKAPVAAAQLRKIFRGPIIAAGGFNRSDAQEIVERGDADLVAFGRFFSSNPDLPDRLRRDLPLTPYDRSTFWGGDGHGYTDFLPWRDVADAAA